MGPIASIGWPVQDFQRKLIATCDFSPPPPLTRYIVRPWGGYVVLIPTCSYRMTSQELAVRYLYGARRKRTYLWGIANKKGADQPARPRSLISAFVICLIILESLISKLAICEFSLVSLQGSTYG